MKLGPPPPPLGLPREERKIEKGWKMIGLISQISKDEAAAIVLFSSYTVGHSCFAATRRRAEFCLRRADAIKHLT